MKRVTKGLEPVLFRDWKGRANEDWQPSYGSLAGQERQALHEALVAEQGFVCCYCGRAIDVLDSHIEHFRPQHGYPELALAYANLHASCVRQPATYLDERGQRLRKPRRLPVHCGHAKAGEFDEELHIEPVSATCEERFIFGLDGSIYPAQQGDAHAKYMLGLLALDEPYLRARRGEALRYLLDDSISLDELRRFEEEIQRPDAEGRLRTFSHAIARYLRQQIAALQPANAIPDDERSVV